MQISNLTLAYLVAELKPLVEGSIVRKVQELENSWLKFKLQTRQGSKDLVAAPSAIFLTSYSLQAKQQGSGFGAFLRKKLSNKRIISLQQHSLDRIALLEFDEFFLIIELFAKGNIVLATKQMEIVAPLRREQWKDREIAKGSLYKFPSSKGFTPLEVSAAELRKIFAASSVDFIRTLISALNIAPIAAEEACLKARVDKAKEAKKASAKELEKVLASLKEIYSVDLKKLKPGLAAGQLLPFEMLSAGKFEKSFASLNEAMDELFSAQFGQQKSSAVETPRAQQLERSIERQMSARAELEKEIIEMKAKGEAVYASYQAINSALEFARAFAAGKIDKKDVMYKLSALGFELKQIDLKNKKIVVDLKH